MTMVGTRTSAPEVQAVYGAERMASHSARTLRTGREARNMFELIVRSTPELADLGIQFEHIYHGSCEGTLRTYSTGRMVLLLHARGRNMATLLHELAHAIHVRRIGFVELHRLVVHGEDHNADWRRILLDLCAVWAPAYGIALEGAFASAGLTIPLGMLTIKAGGKS